MPPAVPPDRDAPGPRENAYERRAGYAAFYRDTRFDSGTGRGTDRRERRALRALLACTPACPPGPWLDLPSGAGRLSRELPGPVVQVDRGLEMLRAMARADRPAAVCASGLALPFADGVFAGALCMRLVQHLPEAAQRAALFAELRRVCGGPLILSYFQAASLSAWRRRRRRPQSRRSALRWHQLRDELEAHGWRVLQRRPLARWLSEQELVLAAPAGSAR